MSGQHGGLAERIRSEVSDLSRTVEKCQRAWSQALSHPNQQDMFLDSVALSLHGIYSGVETLFSLIARRIDGLLPESSSWHRLLLAQMAEERPAIRPAVISVETQAELDEYRRFRHFVRNVYSVNILPDRLEKLVLRLPALWNQTSKELCAFADFLEDA